MNYLDFVNIIETLLSGTTISGSTYLKYIEKCLEDEIEVKPSTIYPACFICPIPFSFLTEFQVSYGVRIYIAEGITDRTKRFDLFSNSIRFLTSFIQNLPSNFYGIRFGIEIKPILLFDSSVDGITFDLNIVENTDCYI
jgi:hypothetical protein